MSRSTAVAGWITSGGLVLVALMHLLWTFSRWPLESDAEFGEVVVGSTSGEAPPAMASGGVAVALIVAAWLVARRAQAPPERQQWHIRLGAWAVATVLLIRGSLGMFVSGLDLTEGPERYDRWDLWLYSPLCILLGTLSLWIAMSGERFASRGAQRTIWAGRLLVFVSLMHVAGWMDFSADQLSGWLEGDARTSTSPVDVSLTQSEAYFWALPGSFAPAGLILGLLLIRLGRAETTVPAFVGWGLGAWAVVVTFIMPTPAILLTIPAGLVILAARASDRVERADVASPESGSAARTPQGLAAS